MNPPEYTGKASVTSIVSWFIHYDLKIGGQQNERELNRIISDEINSVLDQERKDLIHESINRLYHEYVLLASEYYALEEETITNQFEKVRNEQMGLEVFIRIAQLRVLGWVYSDVFDEPFIPYGNSLDVMGHFDDYVDHYDILGVSQHAELEEIKSAYRKLAKVHHPDIGGDLEKFKAIKASYEILSDHLKRSEFDGRYHLYQKKHLFDTTENIDLFEYQYSKKTKAEIGKPLISWDRIISSSFLIIAALLLIPFLLSSVTSTENPSADNPASTESIEETESEKNEGAEDQQVMQNYTEIEEFLDETYSGYLVDGIEFIPIFELYNNEEDDGAPIIMNIYITTDGYEYILHQPTLAERDDLIENVIWELSEFPVEEFGADNLIVELHLFDYLLYEPDDTLYNFTHWNSEVEQWEVSEYMGHHDGYNNTVHINPKLPEVMQGDDEVTASGGAAADDESQTEEPAVSQEQSNVSGDAITLGSDEAHVRSIMGTPEAIIGHMWRYGSSYVTFDYEGYVSGWNDIDGVLNVDLGSKKSDAPPFTTGSTGNDVVNAMGTPKAIIGHMWRYGSSYVTFDYEGYVSGWNDMSGVLKTE